jgi:hypothetical protein
MVVAVVGKTVVFVVVVAVMRHFHDLQEKCNLTHSLKDIIVIYKMSGYKFKLNDFVSLS